MFTGIIEGTGTVRSIERRESSARIEVEASFSLNDLNVGDSIAVDGCCLTVTSRLGNRFWSDVSEETLRVTKMGRLRIGDRVNMERALRVGERLSGHIVQGHVDGVGEVLSCQDVCGGKELKLRVPGGLTRYIVEKGSIAVDGVSLTVNTIRDEAVSIRLVAHTVEQTIFRDLAAGALVNLEVDIVGKYVEKLTFLRSDQYHANGEIADEFLKKHGFKER